MNERVAGKLRGLRDERGITRDELAVRLDVPAAAVEAWESGIDLPNTTSLVKLAKIYNVSLDSLLLEDDSSLAAPRVADAAEAAQGGSASYAARSDETFDHTDDYRFSIGGAKVRVSRAQFPYPIIVTAAFLAAGFLFDWWHPGWLIFLTIPLYYTMPDFEREPLRSALLKFPYPVLVTLVYLSLGCFLNWWHPWWMLYLTVPLYYIFASNADRA
ncbi:MAG: helix-turn-helix domain-containing protein [Oscillospiraceae bacterium]|jgi:transcriptional regulator with XRE-family HTH domain|nr:helix-turn-helix domain-containing protein [Oscillospiraceae bacterium]